MSTHKTKSIFQQGSFDMGMSEPLLRPGSEKSAGMRQSRSPSFKQMIVKLLDHRPETEEDRLQRTSTNDTLSYFFPVIWKKSDCCGRTQLVFSFIFLLLIILLVVLAPIALKFAVDGLVISFKQFLYITNTEGLTPGQVIIEAAVHSWDNDQAPTFWVGIYILLRVLASMFIELRDYCLAKSLTVGQTAISEKAMAHIQKLSISSFQRDNAMKAFKTITQSAKGFAVVARALLFLLLPIFIELIIILVIFLIMLPWYFSLAFILTLLVYFIFSCLFYIWRTRKVKVRAEQEASFKQKAQDAIRYFEAIRFFNAESHEVNRYGEALADYRRESESYYIVIGITNFLRNLVINGGLLASLLLACHDVYQGKLEVGDFVMILAFIIQLYVPLSMIGPYFRMIRQGRRDADQIFQIFLKGSTPLEPRYPEIPRFKDGHLKLENVSFSYDSPFAEKRLMMLRNVTFQVKAGTRVAIVGPPGSGKSTIFKLLNRFYDIQEGGRISLDGYDIRKLKSSDIRQGISSIPQNSPIFNDTLGYNIGYGGVASKLDATTDLQLIQSVAKSAKIHNFILSQKNDYQTKVGTNTKLQRVTRAQIGLARALEKRGSVLFCVDAIGADIRTNEEDEFQALLKEVLEDMTTIVIAHKLASIQDCDQIIVMNQGMVVEQGTHPELMSKEGLYKQMWEQQAFLLENDEDMMTARKGSIPGYGLFSSPILNGKLK